MTDLSYDDADDPEVVDYDGDQLDLAERLSLRRVAGMSTQLADITEVEYRDLQLERVVLVSVWTQGTQADVDNALAELKLLAETAGSDVLEALVQRRSHPDPATFIGRGKVDELREVVIATGADTVICDGELEPAQLRTLEDRVKVKVAPGTPSGRVLRVKGFVQDAAGWVELNATADGLTAAPIPAGQEVLIVIGEGLDKKRIEAVLRN